MNIKSIFSKTALIASAATAIFFLGTLRAHANSYVYNCPDGGAITTYTGLSPADPYGVNTQTPITATALLNSTCGTRSVSVSASHNLADTSPDYYYNGGKNPRGFAPIISGATISPGQSYPLNGVPASTTFYSASASGTYTITFRTGVDETATGGSLMHLGVVGQYVSGGNTYKYYGSDIPASQARGHLIIKVNGTTVCDTIDPNTAVYTLDSNNATYTMTQPPTGYTTSNCGSTFYQLNAGDVVYVSAQSYASGYHIGTLSVDNEYKYDFHNDPYGNNLGTGDGWMPVVPQNYNCTGSKSGSKIVGSCSNVTYSFTAGGGMTYYVNSIWDY